MSHMWAQSHIICMVLTIRCLFIWIHLNEFKFFETVARHIILIKINKTITIRSLVLVVESKRMHNLKIFDISVNFMIFSILISPYTDGIETLIVYYPYLMKNDPSNAIMNFSGPSKAIRTDCSISYSVKSADIRCTFSRLRRTSIPDKAFIFMYNTICMKKDYIRYKLYGI